jgi:hypothetical protein
MRLLGNILVVDRLPLLFPICPAPRVDLSVRRTTILNHIDSFGAFWRRAHFRLPRGSHPVQRPRREPSRKKTASRRPDLLDVETVEPAGEKSVLPRGFGEAAVERLANRAILRDGVWWTARRAGLLCRRPKGPIRRHADRLTGPSDDPVSGRDEPRRRAHLAEPETTADRASEEAIKPSIRIAPRTAVRGTA